MKRLIPILLVLVVFVGVILLSTLFIALRSRALAAPPATSVAMVAVTAQPVTPSRTPPPTDIPSPTATATATTTLTASPTDTTTPTSTLATLVLKLTSVNSDVTLWPMLLAANPSTTPTALSTVDVPTPPVKLAAVPPDNTPLVGWYEYSIQDPAIQYGGQWALFDKSWHSINRQYIYSNDQKARLTLRFLGAAIRLRYVKYFNYGVFQIRIDGKVVTTIDSYYPKSGQGNDGDFATSDVFSLANGWHTLEVISLAQKNPASGGIYIAMDGLDVYVDGPEPTAITAVPTLTPSFTSSPAAAQKIELVAAPPTIMPTLTELTPAVTSVSLTIAYDKNNNKAADANEGVQGIAVRLITVDTNQVVTTGYTNGEGYVHIEATGNTPLRLVVPYLNKFWDIPARSSAMQMTLLLPPANQPGLIP